MRTKSADKSNFHYFNKEYAKEYGIVEAVIIQHFSYCIKSNKNKKFYQHDGRVWTYGSAETFTETFDYFSVYQIRRALKNLEEKGVLVTGNYNKFGYDKTKWYAFKDEEKFINDNG